MSSAVSTDAFINTVRPSLYHTMACARSAAGLFTVSRLFIFSTVLQQILVLKVKHQPKRQNHWPVRLKSKFLTIFHKALLTLTPTFLSCLSSQHFPLESHGTTRCSLTKPAMVFGTLYAGEMLCSYFFCTHSSRPSYNGISSLVFSLTLPVRGDGSQILHMDLHDNM